MGTGEDRTGGVTRCEVLAAGVAAAGVAAALPASLLAASEPRKVGIAVVGLGGYAQGQMLPAFARAKNVRIAGLVSGTPGKLAELGTKYGVPERSRYSYKDMDRIAEDPEIEAVYVVTPPGTHPEYTLRAARAGKHVLCEKPMAATSAQAREMIEGCRRAGRLLMIGCRSLFEPHNLRAIEACRKGELGAIRSVASEHGFSAGRGTWRLDKALAGGGALWDIGIYGVSAARYLTGEDAVEVTAMGTELKGDERFREVDDVTHMVLRMPGGALASISTGYSWSGANNYRVIGARSSLVAEPATSYAGNRLTIGGRPAEVPAGDQFAAMLDHLGEAVLAGARTTRAPGEMGLTDLLILEGALRSAREGRSVRLGG